ncbi:MAG: N-acetylglucosamine kinase [Enterobacteriaceae bacterium]
MYYGFDMGGSKIELAVFDSQLNPLWQKRLPTPRDDYDALLNTFVTLAQEADSHFGAQGQIGIGVPGIPDQVSGTVFTTNVPATRGKPFIADLQRLLQRPVKINNDANCFALSEAWHEEFRHYSPILGVILGTGLGGGLVVEGKSVMGLNTIAGEIGHLRLTLDALDILGADIPRVPCGCGKSGCFEGYLSGRGFEWLYHHFSGQSLSASAIIERYRQGETEAREHVQRYIQLLAVYMGAMLTLFDPQLVVIGGGLSNFDELYTLLPAQLPPYLYSVARLPRFEKARYGDAGGARGAALLNMTQ